MPLPSRLPFGPTAAVGDFPVGPGKAERRASLDSLLGKMVTNSAWLLLLILWNVLRETESSKPPHSFKYASYEVTIPRKVVPRDGQEDSLEVTYHLQIEGKGRMVHLWQKKGFIPKNFPVFTYSKQGELQVDYPLIRIDCFYQGYIEGKPSSLVTLSTCSGGFRGLFQLENNTYEIEPVPASPIFHHVVYRLKEQETDAILKCGLTEEEQSRQEAMMQNAENLTNKNISGRSWWSHTRYVKIAVVVEYEKFMRFDKNETLTIIQVMNVIHIANVLYDPLSIQLSLTGLEIWSRQNFIAIGATIKETLASFTKWRRDSLLKRLQNDVGYLFLFRLYRGIAGLAYLGTVCNKDKGSGILSHITYSLASFSNVFVHELGHNLGMRHDEHYCDCDQPICIMDSHISNSYKFSNCSYSDYFRLRNTDCLLIPPAPNTNLIFKYCGNKIVEEGEQCDCGSKTECLSDPCCQADCKFRQSATCAFGECCVRCRYLKKGYICRENTSICDLPEYCFGDSVWCPKDVYVQDGTPCSDESYCYHGNCTTHSKQCQKIFDKKATVASKDCFRQVNAHGDRFGNCGLKHGRYTKCSPEHSLCGRVQCKNVRWLPLLQEHHTLIHTGIGSQTCWGTDYHIGMNVPDIGAVTDGTPCGTYMICLNQKCMNVSVLNYDCDHKMCNYHGICNSNKNCHCIYGWAPPFCDKKGYGGSIDSGPIPRPDSTTAEDLFRYLFIPLVCVFVVLSVIFRHQLVDCCRRLVKWFDKLKPKKAANSDVVSNVSRQQRE